MDFRDCLCFSRCISTEVRGSSCALTTILIFQNLSWKQASYWKPFNSISRCRKAAFLQDHSSLENIPEETRVFSPYREESRRHAVCEMHLRRLCSPAGLATMVFSTMCVCGGREKIFADECAQPIRHSFPLCRWMARVVRGVKLVASRASDAFDTKSQHYYPKRFFRRAHPVVPLRFRCARFVPWKTACGEDFASLCRVSRAGIS